MAILKNVRLPMTLQVAPASGVECTSGTPSFFEITLRCHSHAPWLRSETHAAKLARLIDRSSALFDVELVAFVFLPDHAHLVVRCPREECAGDWAAHLLHGFADEVRADALRGLTRPAAGRPVWEPALPRIRCLVGSAEIAAAIGCAHKNPVRRGLCDSADEWRWSSWRHYHERPELLDPEFPRIRAIEQLPETELLAPA